MFVDVKGYEGLYAVNKFGDVLSYQKASSNGKLLKPFEQKKGHMRVVLYKDGARKQHLIHRLVATAFIRNPSNLPFINHIDCNPSNNNVENLEWCSASDNAIHAYKNGLTNLPCQKGANNSRSKLTQKDVDSIRKMHKEVGNCSEIARIYQLNPKTVNDIIHFKRWK